MFDTRALLEDLHSDMTDNRLLYVAENRMVVRELHNLLKEVFFLAIEPAEERRLLIIPLFNKMGNMKAKNFPLCKGIKVEKILFDKIGPLHNQNCITVSQTSSDNSTFEAFISSLLEDLWPCQAKDVFVTTQKTLQKWHVFFSKIGDEGLSPEQCRGLYGELHVLRGLLQGGVNPSLVNYWQGPYREHIDFRVEGLGIEVKTTLSYNPIKVTISSEEQLAGDEVDDVILGVLSLKLSRKNGETLNQIIEEIKLMLSNWPLYLKVFQDGIHTAGYHSLHSEFYEIEKYIILDKQYYKVERDFPRILPSELPKGIVNVRYDVILDGLKEYVIHDSKIIAMIQEL